VAHCEPVRAERARERVDLLDAPVPQVAALVVDPVALQLVDPELQPVRVALRREPT